MTNRPDHHEHEMRTPEELRAVEARVERLAEAERRAAGAGFEQRIASVVRRTLAEPAPAMRFPSGVRATQWRLAAAVMLTAIGGLSTIGWLTGRRGGPAGVASKQGTVAADTETIREDLDTLLASIEERMEEEELAEAGSPVGDSFWNGGSEDLIFLEESM